jgi:LPS-assembly protein
MTRIPALRQLGMTILFILVMTSVAESGGAIRELQLPIIPSSGQDHCRAIAYERLKQILLKDLVADRSVQATVAAARISTQRFIVLAAGATRIEIVNETCRDGICHYKARINDGPGEISRIIAEISKNEQHTAALESASAKAHSLIRELEDLQIVITAAKGDLKTASRFHEAVQKLVSVDRLEEGIMFLTKGNPRRALESFSQSIQSDPRLSQAYIQRGTIYGMLGQCEQALTDFNISLELEPANAAIFMGRGAAHACVGNYDQAVSDYGRVIAMSSRNHEAYHQRALAFAATGNFQEAINHYDKVVEIKPSHAMAYLKRAVARDALGDSHKAMLDYTRAIELGLGLSTVYGKRGIAFSKQHDYERAVKDFDKALSLNPEDSEAHLLRSKAYAALGLKEIPLRDNKMVSDYSDSMNSKEMDHPEGAAEYREQSQRTLPTGNVSAVGFHEGKNAEKAIPESLRYDQEDLSGMKQGHSPEGYKREYLPSHSDMVRTEVSNNDGDLAGQKKDYLTVSGESPPVPEILLPQKLNLPEKKKAVSIQVLSSAQRESAIQCAQKFEKEGYPNVVVVQSGGWYALMIGRYSSAKEAGAALRTLRFMYRDAFLRSSPEIPVKLVYDGTRKEKQSGKGIETAQRAPSVLPLPGSESEPHLTEGYKKNIAQQRPISYGEDGSISGMIRTEDLQAFRSTVDDRNIQAVESVKPGDILKRQQKSFVQYAQSHTGTSYDVPERADEPFHDVAKPDPKPERTVGQGVEETGERKNIALADENQIPATEARSAVTFNGILQDPFGKPLPGATIEKVDDPSIRSVSGAGGRFSLTGLPGDSDYLLKVELAGYLPVFISSLQYPPSASRTLSFTLYPLSASLPAEKTKQPVVIEADSLLYERDTDTYYARGHVIISYTGNPGGVLTADEANLSRTTNQAEAIGNVIVKSGKDSIYGDRIVMDIDTKEGSVYKGRMFLSENHFYVKGDRIDKKGDATYHVENASATTCDGDAPDWRILGSALDVTIDGYGTIKNGRFLAKDLPLVYTPYFLFPAKTTRQSGLLLPYTSYSRDKLGLDTEIPFYWAISKNMDATFYQRYMSQRGFKEGMEFRYSLSPDHYGTFYADFLNDNKRLLETNGAISRDWQPGEKRWSVYLNHISNISPGFYLRSDIAKVSDNWYFKDFSDHNYYLSNYSTTQTEKFRKVSFLADESVNSLDSTVRMVKDWQSFNLTGLVRYTDDFTKQSNDTTLQKFPELTLTGVKQPVLGSRVYYEMSSIYGYYYRIQGQKGQLFDMKPTFSLPFNLGTALQITPLAGWQGSLWERDDSQIDTGNRHGNRQLFNMGGTATTEVQRIFNVGGESLDKNRHSIKPEVTYTYIPNVDQVDIPDYVPVVPGQNSVTYAVTNTLTGRIKDKAGNASYKEYVRLKMFQTFDIQEARRDVGPIDNARRPFSDVNLELDTSPISYLTLSARNKFSPNSGAWTQTNYDLSLSDPRGDKAIVGYRYTQNVLRETNLTLKGAINKNWELTYFLRRNEDIQQNMENTFGLTYRQQCWSVQLSYSDKISYDAAGVEQPDRTFAILFSFYGLGGVGY